MSESTPLTSAEATSTPDPEKGQESNVRPPDFIQRLKDAKQTSSGPLDFIKAFFLLLLDTVGFLIFVGILLAVPIAMIVIGAMNLDDCPVERYIPLWMLVSGCVIGFMQIVYILKTSFNLSLKRPETDTVGKCYGTFNLLLTLFSFGWFIAGNVWVFSNYPPNITDSRNAEYCEAGVYYFSFALIIAAYAWFLFTLCCSGCVAIAGVKDIAHHASKMMTSKGGQDSGTPAESTQ